MAVVTIESSTSSELLAEVDGSSYGGSYCSGEGCGVHYEKCSRPEKEMFDAESLGEATHALVYNDTNGAVAGSWYRLIWRPKPVDPPSDIFILYRVSGFTTIEDQKRLADASTRNLVALEDKPDERADDS